MGETEGPREIECAHLQESVYVHMVSSTGAPGTPRPDADASTHTS